MSDPEDTDDGRDDSPPDAPETEAMDDDADGTNGEDTDHGPEPADAGGRDERATDEQSPVDDGGPTPGVPLSDLADEVSDDDFGGTGDEHFEREPSPDVDREALWRQVADEETAEQAVEAMDIDADDDATPAGDGSSVETGERVVAKNAYCHSCRFFSSPPDVHCRHEGTEILESVDMDHFRVVDCPVVAENEELEEF